MSLKDKSCGNCLYGVPSDMKNVLRCTAPLGSHRLVGKNFYCAHWSPQAVGPLPLVPDPSVPPGEIHAVQDGNVIGCITDFGLPEDKPAKYLCATTECRVCGWQEVSVYPESCLVEDNQECGRCGAMSAEPIKYHGPVKDREHKHNTGDRLIVCAALRRGDLTIYGPRHGGPGIYALLERLGLTHDDFELGFVDNHWKFVSRREAWTIALAAGQVRYRCGGDTAEGGTLYSENLY